MSQVHQCNLQTQQQEGIPSLPVHQTCLSPRQDPLRISPYRACLLGRCTEGKRCLVSILLSVDQVDHYHFQKGSNGTPMKFSDGIQHLKLYFSLLHTFSVIRRLQNSCTNPACHPNQRTKRLNKIYRNASLYKFSRIATAHLA